MSDKRKSLVDRVLVDRSFVTDDEGYDVLGTVADKIARLFDGVKVDSYNEQYLVRVLVTRLGASPADHDGEDE
jgi:hypothetical protein